MFYSLILTICIGAQPCTHERVGQYAGIRACNAAKGAAATQMSYKLSTTKRKDVRYNVECKI